VLDAELFRALSPIHRFDALRAPLLVVHGETDSNVPVFEAEQVVAAARARGVPVEYLLFREEGHELSRVDNKAAFVARTAAWLERWLSSEPTAHDGTRSVARGAERASTAQASRL
jgi:dipeptidyl aminopeptidase/acylaminoacyl peptidase